MLTPNVLAHWVNFKPDSYTETGAGGADLNVSGKTLNVFELGGGVKAGWVLKNEDGSVIEPQLRVGYSYNLADANVQDTTSFVGGGGSFLVNGANQSRSKVNLGASLKYLTTQNWTMTGSYDFDWKDSYTSNTGLLRADYRF